MEYDLHVTEESTANRARRTIKVVRPVERGGDVSVEYEFTGPLLPPPISVADFAVIGVIFYAMREGAALRVRGPVSRELLSNIEEFQDAWCCWRPSLYTRVRVSADLVLDGPSPAQRSTAVLAYSGGVDASFTLLRHVKKLAGDRSREVVATVLIHGFDIPLSRQDAFDVALDGAMDVTSSLGMPLVAVRTNWREALHPNWPDAFGAGLAAVLHQYTGVASVGLLASDEDYAHLVLPWGSNPITNPLLTGSQFRIVTDGGGSTRSEKVGLLADYPPMVRNLRVCWEGPLTGRNCGRCEKCIRTYLNFLVQGRVPDRAFPIPVSIWQIATVRAMNQVQVEYLLDIHEMARRRGIRKAWVHMLGIAIVINRLLLMLRRVKSAIANVLRLSGVRSQQ